MVNHCRRFSASEVICKQLFNRLLVIRIPAAELNAFWDWAKRTIWSSHVKYHSCVFFILIVSVPDQSLSSTLHRCLRCVLPAEVKTTRELEKGWCGTSCKLTTACPWNEMVPAERVRDPSMSFTSYFPLFGRSLHNTLQSHLVLTCLAWRYVLIYVVFQIYDIL